MAATPKMAPNTNSSNIIPISEITKPATAIPFGFLKIPTEDKISPKSHTIQPKTGTHPRNKPIKAKIKPAVPMLLDFFSC